MTQPTPYVPAYSFTGYQRVNPTSPLPGDKIDANNNLLKDTLDEILANLALIQRDDGEVANQTIGYEQLKPELVTGIAPAEAWATATVYAVSDAVFYEAKLYRCLVAHTSGVFATDLAADKWIEIADFGVFIADYPFTLPGTVASRSLETRLVEEILSLDDFKLAEETTYDNAFVRARAYFEARNGGQLRLPHAKVTEVTAPVNYRDLTKPIRVVGYGQLKSLLYGNFVGAGDGVLDMSFTGTRIAGCGAEGFTICANGVVGDPIGLVAKRAFQQYFRDLWFPGDGDTIMGATRRLLNSAMIITQANNCDISNSVFKAGYQPVAYPIASNIRFSVAMGDNTCTADSAATPFSAGMVGQVIIFEDGGASGDSIDYWWTTIASFTSSNEVELTDAPPEAIVSKRATVGCVTGSMTNTDKTLTLDQAVLTTGAAMVGMRVMIPRADLKSDASNTKGWLCTSIESVTDTSNCELVHAAEADVASLPIIFAPNFFAGELREEEGEGTQTNDLTIHNCQFEGYQAVGIAINKAINVSITDSKTEAENFGTAGNNVARSLFNMILSEVKDVKVTNHALGYCYHPIYGMVWVQGSRGSLAILNTGFGNLLRGAPVVYIDDEVNDNFRLPIGPCWNADGLAKHPASWNPIRIPASRLTAVDYIGPIYDRDGNVTFGARRKHPGYQASTYYGGGIKPVAPASPYQVKDKIYAHAFHLKHRANVAGLFVNVDTGVPSTMALLGIYRNVIGQVSGKYRPGLLIAQGATEVSGESAVGVESLFSSSVILEEGIYWMACLQEVDAMRLRAIDVSDNYPLLDMMGGSTIATAVGLTGGRIAVTFDRTYSDGLPSDLTGNNTIAAVTTNVCPHVGIKTAA